MRIKIISVGKKHDELFVGAINEYEKRLGKGVLSWVFVNHSDKEKESQQIFRVLKDEKFILLDEKGKSFSTKELANFLEKNQTDGNAEINFIIGGAYGVSEELKQKSKQVWSLSALTFPHMLVRLILAEQIYRAVSIMSGGKYHHE